jgi:hypothetical protein
METFWPSPQLLEVASWRLAAEIVRRYPSIRIIETHPGGGQYDCLQLLLEQGDSNYPSIHLNRAGSLHVFASDGALRSWPEFWPEYLAAEDPRSMLNQVCEFARLPRVRRLSPSTPAVIVYRFIAAFLASTVLGRTRWECRNGFADSSMGSGVREESFAAVPRAREALALTDETMTSLGSLPTASGSSVTTNPGSVWRRRDSPGTPRATSSTLLRSTGSGAGFGRS